MTTRQGPRRTSHAPSSAPAVELCDVHKTFTVRTRAGRLRRDRHEVHAVDGIDLTVAPGSIVGYIGPNGAGKSTTIKMLTGILVPSSGSVRVAGLDPTRNRIAVTSSIGVVFGQRSQLWWDLPLQDSFDLLRHVYRVERAVHAANLERCADLLDLGGFMATPVRQLSLGQRMRGEITAALLHDPSILLLDEPTIGLDVVSKEAVRAFLLHLNRDLGTTILLTTHDLADVERLCQRLVIIDRGKVIEDDSIASVKQRHGTRRTLVIDLAAPRPALVLRSFPSVVTTKVEGPRQWLSFDRASTTAAELFLAVTEIVGPDAVLDLTVEEPEVDDVIRRIYERSGGA